MQRSGRRHPPEGEEPASAATPADTPSDAELVLQLRAQDPHAFETLFRRYFETLVRFASYLLGSRDTAQDVVQDIFVRIWEHPETFAPRSLKQYLYTAVRNHVLDIQRHASVQQRHQGSVLASIEAEPSLLGTPSAENTILNEATMEAAILRLSERRQQAVRLHVKEQLTPAEVGQLLGISPVAAERLIFRALSDLRKILRVSV